MISKKNRYNLRKNQNIGFFNQKKNKLKKKKISAKIIEKFLKSDIFINLLKNLTYKNNYRKSEKLFFIGSVFFIFIGDM